MGDIVRILGRANSFNVRKVLWVCDELGLAWEREDWGRGYRSTGDPDFLVHNPIGLIPAVIVDGVSLRESNTIIRYLATRSGADALYPQDAVARARVEQWMDWANYETSISLRGAFLGGQLKEDPWNNDWFIAQGRKDITHQVGQIEAHLGNTGLYMAGENFTLADVPVGLVVNRWFHLEFDRPDYPNVSSYYELLSHRPAYLAHVRNGLP